MPGFGISRGEHVLNVNVNVNVNVGVRVTVRVSVSVSVNGLARATQLARPSPSAGDHAQAASRAAPTRRPLRNSPVATAARYVTCLHLATAAQRLGTPTGRYITRLATAAAQGQGDRRSGS